MRNATGVFPAVLMVGNGFGGGGAEARLSRLATHLFEGHVDVALLTGSDSLVPPTPGEIYNLQWIGKRSYPRIVWQLRGLLRSKKYDVVIAFGLFPVAATSIAIMSMPRKPKFVVSEITRPLAAERSLNGIRRLMYLYMRKAFYKNADLITANSADGLAETCEIVNVDPRRAVRLPNIIDKDRIDKAATESVDLPQYLNRYIICVGRLDGMKRIDTVINAFGLLNRHVDVGLLIVGDGEARHDLESKAKALNLDKLITFTGRLCNPFPLLKRAVAFVLASEYEGFSNSVLEAMFCDVPVITSYCSSDAREMCNQGAALGFEVGDAAQLSMHIAAVVSDVSLRQKLVCAAQEYRQQHKVDHAIPVYESMIRRAACHDSGKELIELHSTR